MAAVSYSRGPAGGQGFWDGLSPWLVLSAAIVALLIFVALHLPKPRPVTLPGPPAHQEIFQVMPEPSPAQAPARRPPAQAVPVPKPAPARPAHVRPLPKPRVAPAPQAPARESQPAIRRQPAPQAMTAPSPPTERQAPPPLNLGALDTQMNQAAKALTASPPLPKFKNPHSLVAQEYIAAWIQKVERIGDLNYPGDLTGELVLRATINEDGQLAGVELLGSSGNTELDNAAERIIRIAAPYAPFSKELKSQTHKLEITTHMIFLGARNMNANFGPPSTFGPP